TTKIFKSYRSHFYIRSKQFFIGRTLRGICRLDKHISFKYYLKKMLIRYDSLNNIDFKKLEHGLVIMDESGWHTEEIANDFKCQC
ncbi:hypothetical protein CGJ18_24660, partial [Vibrio parahaemolyticus]